MYIQERARRQGLAGLLIAFLEEQLIARGVKTVKVLTGHDNHAAIGVYEKSGYKREDEVFAGISDRFTQDAEHRSGIDQA